MSEPTLTFGEVHRHFGDRAVLRGLSFEVRPGEVFALLGRNGSGKTTAMRILLGLLRPHRGHTRILGHDSTALTAAQRDRIGYVAEDHRHYPELTVADTLAFEAATRRRFDHGAARDGAARCGLALRQRVGWLSRGQRAQLALLVAAAAQPDVLVFDDPALGLDVAMRRELLDTLIELLADRGCAVLFSTHVFADVERVADRVGVLHDGALRVDARLDDLRARVRKCTWRGRTGASPPRVPGLLRQRPVRDGVELTLVDAADGGLDELRASADLLTDPVSPDLEELFLDLTTESEVHA